MSSGHLLLNMYLKVGESLTYQSFRNELLK